MEFENNWYIDEHKDANVAEMFSEASKRKTGEKGYPDLNYYS